MRLQQSWLPFGTIEDADYNFAVKRNEDFNINNQLNAKNTGVYSICEKLLDFRGLVVYLYNYYLEMAYHNAFSKFIIPHTTNQLLKITYNYG